MLSPFFILSLILMLKANPIIRNENGTMEVNMKTNYNTDHLDYQRRYCYRHQDCFNCTLQGCNWQGERCYDRAQPQLISDLFAEAGRCGDPLSFCPPVDLAPVRNASGVLVAPEYSLGFKKLGQFVTIPDNYFCIVTIPNYYRPDGTPTTLENSKLLKDCSFLENCKF